MCQKIPYEDRAAALADADYIRKQRRYSVDNRIDGRKCVTIYAKDYDRKLGEIFAEYRNETDTQTDYFDKGHVDLFEDHPLYNAARARAEAA